MAEAITLQAQAREKVGKGAARATRREGLVPAVIYGGNREAQPIAIERRVLAKLLEDPSFYTHLFDVYVGRRRQRCMARDVQLDVIRDLPIHADFLRVSDQTVVTVSVPMHFINEEACEGLERGGILNVVRHEVEVQCRAADIPESLTVDLTGFDVGDSIHISHVPLPKSVQPTIQDRDFTVASIVSPRAGVAAAESGAEAGEEEAEDEA